MLQSTINAMVSHEIRGPLTAIEGQLLSIEQALDDLKCVTSELEGKVTISPYEIQELVQELMNLELGINISKNKINSSAKFIRFFVRDILDFTVLSKDEKNFTKTTVCCSLRVIV